ncbi:hypothetical protein EDD85DRAFT_795135 [Armillaria nabsnona]|nr:hypothetical protein EDD85DRAFT_795135 [Armillaria nabsnona]
MIDSQKAMDHHLASKSQDSWLPSNMSVIVLTEREHDGWWRQIVTINWWCSNFKTQGIVVKKDLHPITDVPANRPSLRILAAACTKRNLVHTEDNKVRFYTSKVDKEVGEELKLRTVVMSNKSFMKEHVQAIHQNTLTDKAEKKGKNIGLEEQRNLKQKVGY